MGRRPGRRAHGLSGPARRRAAPRKPTAGGLFCAPGHRQRSLNHSCWRSPRLGFTYKPSSKPGGACASSSCFCCTRPPHPFAMTATAKVQPLRTHDLSQARTSRPSRPIAGDTTYRTLEQFSTPGGRASAGVWEATAGAFRAHLQGCVEFASMPASRR